MLGSFIEQNLKTAHRIVRIGKRYRNDKRGIK
jgi:hypothetical protein